MDDDNFINTFSNQDNFMVKILSGEYLPKKINSKQDIQNCIKEVFSFLFKIDNMDPEKNEYETKEECLDKIKDFLIKISKNKHFTLKNMAIDPLSFNVLFSFFELFRLKAPSDEFLYSLGQTAVEYYLGLFCQLFLNFKPEKNDSEENKLNIEYIIKRGSEKGLFNLICSTQYESNAFEIIKKLFEIQKYYKYSQSTTKFEEIVKIIINLFFDKIINDDILIFLFNCLLSKSKVKNKEDDDDNENNSQNDNNDLNYYLALNVLERTNNTLCSNISALIMSKKIADIKDKKYMKLLKILSIINSEYLFIFFGKVENENDYVNKKILGVSCMDILIKIFSTKNGLNFINKYTKVFFSIIDLLKSNISQNEKYKIFKHILKMLSRNKFKNENEKLIYANIIEKLKAYLKGLKNNRIVISALEQANKLNKWKLIKLVSLSLLNINNPQILKDIIQFIFNEILIKKIINKTIVLDFNSIDKLKILNKVSEIFNKILEKVNDDKYLMIIFLKCLNNTFLIKPSKDDKEGEISEYFNPIAIITIYIFFTHRTTYYDNLFKKILLFYYFPQLGPYKNFNLPIISKEDENKSSKNSKSNYKKNLDQSIDSDAIEIANLVNYSNSLEFFINSQSNKFYIDELINFFRNYLYFVDEETNQICVLLLNSLFHTFTFFVKYLRIKHNENPRNINNNNSDDTKIDDSFNIKNIEIKYVKKIKENIIVPYLEQQMKNIDSCESMLNLLHEIIFLCKDDFNTLNDITQMVTNDISDFILKDEIFPLKTFAKLYYDLSFCLYNLNEKANIDSGFTPVKNEINIQIEFRILPAKFKIKLHDLLNLNNMNYLKFINEIFKNDTKNYYNDVLFEEKIREFIMIEIPMQIEYNRKLRINALKKSPKNTDNFKSLRSLICIEHEVMKYKLYELCKNKEKLESIDCDVDMEMNDYLKEILRAINNYFQSEYIDEGYYKKLILKLNEKCNKGNSSNSKKENDSDSENEENENNSNDEESLIELDDDLLFKEDLSDIDKDRIKKEIKKIKRRLKNKCQPLLELQLINIAKYINLIIRFCENQIQIAPTYQVQLSNILLIKESFIREHFINRINKKLTKQGSDLNYFFNIIPILMLSLNDKNKKISKISQNLIASFFTYMYNKINEENRKKKITESHNYKYIPEVYLSYLLVYFVFNPNLNRLFQEGNEKYFTEIITAYLKIIKKQCKNCIDSNFLLKLLSKIKSKKLENLKIIQNINQSGIFLDLKIYNPLKDIDYELVKNGIVDLAYSIITSQFITDFSYKSFLEEGQDELQAKIPVLFYGEKFENYKSAIKMENNDLTTNNRLLLITSKINLSQVNNNSYSNGSRWKKNYDNSSRISNNFGNISNIQVDNKNEINTSVNVNEFSHFDDQINQNISEDLLVNNEGSFSFDKKKKKKNYNFNNQYNNDYINNQYINNSNRNEIENIQNEDSNCFIDTSMNPKHNENDCFIDTSMNQKSNENDCFIDTSMNNKYNENDCFIDTSMNHNSYKKINKNKKSRYNDDVKMSHK